MSAKSTSAKNNKTAGGAKSSAGKDKSTANLPNDKVTDEVNELKDKLARLSAEWDNYRKRTDSERAQERVLAGKRIISAILPALDDLGRALDAAADDDPLTAGIRAVQDKMLSALASEGLTEIAALGEPFDATLHQAVQQIDDRTVEPETVVQVLQPGYLLGDTVIREAVVAVSQ